MSEKLGRKDEFDFGLFKTAYRKYGKDITKLCEELKTSRMSLWRYMRRPEVKDFMEEKQTSIQEIKQRMKNIGLAGSYISSMNKVTEFLDWSKVHKCKKHPLGAVKTEDDLTPELWLEFFGEHNGQWSACKSHTFRCAARKFFQIKGYVMERTFAREHALTSSNKEVIGQYKDIYIPAEKKQMLRKYFVEHGLLRQLLALELLPFNGARKGAFGRMVQDDLVDMDGRYYIKKYESKTKQHKTNMVPKYVYDLAKQVLTHKPLIDLGTSSMDKQVFSRGLREGYRAIGMYELHKEQCDCGRCELVTLGSKQKKFWIAGKKYFHMMPMHALKHDAVIGILRRTKWNYKVAAKIIGTTAAILETSYGDVPEDIMDELLKGFIEEYEQQNQKNVGVIETPTP